MRLAIDAARRGIRAGQSPFGCAIASPDRGGRGGAQPGARDHRHHLSRRGQRAAAGLPRGGRHPSHRLHRRHHLRAVPDVHGGAALGAGRHRLLRRFDRRCRRRRLQRARICRRRSCCASAAARSSWCPASSRRSAERSSANGRAARSRAAIESSPVSPAPPPQPGMGQLQARDRDLRRGAGAAARAVPRGGGVGRGATGEAHLRRGRSRLSPARDEPGRARCLLEQAAAAARAQHVPGAALPVLPLDLLPSLRAAASSRDPGAARDRRC